MIACISLTRTALRVQLVNTVDWLSAYCICQERSNLVNYKALTPYVESQEAVAVYRVYFVPLPAK